jgi:hypothetical protein
LKSAPAVRPTYAGALCLLLAVTGSARAAPESMEEAWWTGPLLAATASTLPQGHGYFEPYLFDLIPYAHFDNHGHAHSVSHSNQFGSQSYLNYGLADGLTIGLIPRFGYLRPVDAPSSDGVQVGDLTVQAQYRLSHFQPGNWLPTLSFNLQQVLPTGRYDHLDRLSDGFGSGAYVTTPSIYSQAYFWMPNGRILRTRLNFSYSIASHVTLDDQSVYGTSAGFRGHATPGNSTFADLAFEYSATSHWVPALDVWYERDSSTGITGRYPSSAGSLASVALVSRSGPGWELILAPALEYNWNARIGLIIGTRMIVAGSNETATLAPVIAFSYFH